MGLNYVSSANVNFRPRSPCIFPPMDNWWEKRPYEIPEAAGSLEPVIQLDALGEDLLRAGRCRGREADFHVPMLFTIGNAAPVFRQQTGSASPNLQSLVFGLLESGTKKRRRRGAAFVAAEESLAPTSWWNFFPPSSERLLVPASAFFLRVDGQRIEVRPKTAPFFLLAGVMGYWSTNCNPGTLNFGILTQPSKKWGRLPINLNQYVPDPVFDREGGVRASSYWNFDCISEDQARALARPMIEEDATFVPA